MSRRKIKKFIRKFRWLILSIICVILVTLFVLKCSLMAKYKALESVSIRDRKGEVISVLPNSKGSYSHYIKVLPENFEKILINSEDKYFYLHPGINILSLRRIPRGSSTITQQLAKNLLGNENNRSITNKLVEAIYSLGMEIFLSKSSILRPLPPIT